MKILYAVIGVLVFLLLVSNIATYQIIQVTNQKTISDIQSELSAINAKYTEAQNLNTVLKQDVEAMKKMSRFRSQKILK